MNKAKTGTIDEDKKERKKFLKTFIVKLVMLWIVMTKQSQNSGPLN